VTVPTTIDAGAWLGKHLEGEDGDVDLARAMLQSFAEVLMSAQASAVCGAAYGERTEERTTPGTATGTATGTPGSARSTWLSPSCGRAPTTRTGSRRPSAG